MGSNNLLLIDNLSHSFGNRSVLRNISLEVKQQDLVILKGANGAGKTTLLRLISQLIPMQSKCIKRQADLQIAYLESEANGHLLSLSGLENLQISDTKGEARSSLNEWNLPAKGYLKNLPVRSYSTGMKRRLALARLSLSPAQLFLLDEPTNGLDARGIEIFLNWIKKMQQAGAAFLIATHDAQLFQNFSARELHL